MLTTHEAGMLSVARRAISLLDDATLNKSTASYSADLRANVRAYWSGAFDFFDFFSSMQDTVARGFAAAWRSGASECGVSPDEASALERSRLRSEILQETEHIEGLADFVAANSKASGGKLRVAMSRVGLWANRFDAIASLAKTLTCNDKKLEWVIDVSKESCKDCLKLNGKVFRASVWNAAGVLPRSRALDCKGYNCGCRLVVTTKRGSSGPVPSLK